MELPLHPRQHGNEMVMVTVGDMKRKRTFSIHTELICAISEYFRGALSSGFKESVENTVMLEKECPVAFEVLYDYIYTGNVRAASFFISGWMTEDLLWLRVLKLADFVLVRPIKLIAYDRIRDVFTRKTRSVPSLPMINELYDDAPQEGVQRFIVAHSVDTIRRGHSRWDEWASVLEGNSEFAAAIAVHTAKVSLIGLDVHKDHPIGDRMLDAQTLFPEPTDGLVDESDNE